MKEVLTMGEPLTCDVFAGHSVVSEYLKRKPSIKVIEWLDAQDEHSLYISCLTIAELRKGYYKLESSAVSEQESRRAVKISDWIQKLEERFAGRSVEVDNDVLEIWASMCGRSEAEGNKLPVIEQFTGSQRISLRLDSSHAQRG